MSEHAATELRSDGIGLRKVLDSIVTAVLVENYPDAFKGPGALVLHRIDDACPGHVVWGWFVEQSRRPSS